MIKKAYSLYLQNLSMKVSFSNDIVCVSGFFWGGGSGGVGRGNWSET